MLCVGSLPVVRFYQFSAGPPLAPLALRVVTEPLRFTVFAPSELFFLCPLDGTTRNEGPATLAGAPDYHFFGRKELPRGAFAQIRGIEQKHEFDVLGSRWRLVFEVGEVFAGETVNFAHCGRLFLRRKAAPRTKGFRARALLDEVSDSLGAVATLWRCLFRCGLPFCCSGGLLGRCTRLADRRWLLRSHLNGVKMPTLGKKLSILRRFRCNFSRIPPKLVHRTAATAQTEKEVKVLWRKQSDTGGVRRCRVKDA